MRVYARVRSALHILYKSIGRHGNDGSGAGRRVVGGPEEPCGCRTVEHGLGHAGLHAVTEVLFAIHKQNMGSVELFFAILLIL